MGRLFWKFFIFFWLAQITTSIGVGVAIWMRHPQHEQREPPPALHHPPPGRGDHPPPKFNGSPPPPPHSPWPPMLPLLAGSMVSLLFAAGLAAYFSRPIRTLQGAFEAVANGRLDQRIGTPMSSRSDELADLGGQFDYMAGRLQTLIEGQRRLLHDVSHELRSPLARLQAAAALMQQQPERTTEFLARIERDIAHMDRLVGELLSLARLDANADEISMESVDLAELIATVIDAARIEADARRCRVEMTPVESIFIMANGELLRRAIENVLRNALRHSPENTTIEIALRADDELATITIADHGPGVAPEELESIFEPFYRGRNVGMQTGYGLGLAMARRIMQCHDGTIQASLRTERGLVVTMRLPARN